MLMTFYCGVVKDNLIFVCVSERQVFREKLGEVLAEKMLYIVEAMSRHEYVPKIPNQTELDLVFDVSLPDVQPYLFKVTC